MDRHSINKLIMNYLKTEGFKEAAERFREEASVELDVNLDEMDDRIKIRNAVIQGHIAEATRLVHRLHPELLDDDRYLFFHLQQQQLIELIRDNRVEEALKFASEQLAERAEEDSAVLEELERTMALLAFEKPETSPFKDLLAHSHRQKVACELNAAILKAQHAESTLPKVASLLKVVLWAQSELDKKGAGPYPKMTDLAKGRIEQSK